MNAQRDRLEIIIERWTNPTGHTDFLWSVWKQGRRIHMGGAHPTADAAEAEARGFCLDQLQSEAERITRL